MTKRQPLKPSFSGAAFGLLLAAGLFYSMPSTGMSFEDPSPVAASAQEALPPVAPWRPVADTEAARELEQAPEDLSDPTEVAGWVELDDGSSPHGVMVQVNGIDGSVAVVRLEDDGSFRLRLQDASADLVAVRYDGAVQTSSQPISVEPGDHDVALLIAAAPTADVGLTLTSQDGAVVVAGVLAVGTAYSAQLAVGDRVLSVDGVSTAALGLTASEERLLGPDGSSVDLLVENESGQRVVALERRLYTTDDFASAEEVAMAATAEW